MPSSQAGSEYTEFPSQQSKEERPGTGSLPEKTSACYGESSSDSWIQTFSGLQFFPFRPEESEILIEDIAHALSNLCRFTGHVSHFYSVGQHSILVSQLVPPEYAVAGLLHDATEAYLSDIASPIKPGIPGYYAIEERLEKRIFQEFGISLPLPGCVKEADMVAVATEARDLMPNYSRMWKLTRPPLLGVRIDPWTPEATERQFLDRFRRLTR